MNNITSTPAAEPTLTLELKKFIEEWRDKPGNLIMILHKIQEHFGYIPRAIVFELANTIRVPVAKIYGIVTFYHLFKLKKPGKHQIAVCLGTACYLKGAENILQELETILGIGPNAITKDGEFSIEIVRCLGCCGLAPVMTIDGKVYGNIQKGQLANILASYLENTSKPNE